MESKELRIGNWVQYDSKFYQIAGINCDDTIRLICDDECHPNYSHGTIGCIGIEGIEPIPLTKEWLLMFGFEEKLLQNMFEIGFNEGNYSLKPVGDIYSHWYFYHKDKLITTNIRYVHQPQNLTYALTGQELEIKK